MNKSVEDGKQLADVLVIGGGPAGAWAAWSAAAQGASVSWRIKAIWAQAARRHRAGRIYYTCRRTASLGSRLCSRG